MLFFLIFPLKNSRFLSWEVRKKGFSYQVFDFLMNDARCNTGLIAFMSASHHRSHVNFPLRLNPYQIVSGCWSLYHLWLRFLQSFHLPLLSISTLLILKTKIEREQREWINGRKLYRMSVRTFMKFYAIGRPISLVAREKKKGFISWKWSSLFRIKVASHLTWLGTEIFAFRGWATLLFSPYEA